MELTVLYEDKSVLVCEKLAGVPSQSDRTLDKDMLSYIKNYLREKNPQGAVPYVAAVHRLDRPVGGVMVYAKTPKAAAELSRQIQKGEMKKQYMAVVCGDFSADIGKEPKELTDYLKKNGRTNLSEVVSEKDPQAKQARLDYQVLETAGSLSLLNIRLYTGRHHQIRVQLSNHISGIWGDRKYNKEMPEKGGFQEIALYSWSLSFLHPVTKKPMTFEKIPQKYPFSEFKKIQDKKSSDGGY